MVRSLASATLILVVIAASSGAATAQDTTAAPARMEKTFLQLSGMG